MKDYVPSDHLPLFKSLDLIGSRLSDAHGAEDEARAINWLQNALATERFSATAIAENGEMFKVGAALWRSRNAETIFRTGMLPAGNLSESFQRKKAGTLYCRVLVPKAVLENALTAAAKSAGLPSTTASERRCRDWLIKQMCGDPEKTKLRYLEDAQSQFKIGRRAFNRAWDGAIEETGNTKWRRPGRKSKRRIDTPIKS